MIILVEVNENGLWQPILRKHVYITENTIIMKSDMPYILYPYREKCGMPVTNISACVDSPL